MHRALQKLDHRPWPIPRRAWTWRQTWHDLLFAHWPIDAKLIRPLVPRGLEIEEFDGTAWIGIVPFRMTGVMWRWLPDMPGLSAFPELNVRVYVKHRGRSGVWFLSLDAPNRVAIWGARKYFHLPYYRANISLTEHKDSQSNVSQYKFDSRRADAEFVATYQPTSDVYAGEHGTLEHALTERYCLYAQAPDGSLWCNQVHHLQWPIQRAECEIEKNTMFAFHGLNVTGAPMMLHFSKKLEVVVWGGERVS